MHLVAMRHGTRGPESVKSIVLDRTRRRTTSGELERPKARGSNDMEDASEDALGWGWVGTLSSFSLCVMHFKVNLFIHDDTYCILKKCWIRSS